jgi:hypothetical protein
VVATGGCAGASFATGLSAAGDGALVEAALEDVTGDDDAAESLPVDPPLTAEPTIPTARSAAGMRTRFFVNHGFFGACGASKPGAGVKPG